MTIYLTARDTPPEPITAAVITSNDAAILIALKDEIIYYSEDLGYNDFDECAGQIMKILPAEYNTDENVAFVKGMWNFINKTLVDIAKKTRPTDYNLVEDWLQALVDAWSAAVYAKYEYNSPVLSSSLWATGMLLYYGVPNMGSNQEKFDALKAKMEEET